MEDFPLACVLLSFSKLQGEVEVELYVSKTKELSLIRESMLNSQRLTPVVGCWDLSWDLARLVRALALDLVVSRRGDRGRVSI